MKKEHEVCRMRTAAIQELRVARAVTGVARLCHDGSLK